MRGCFGSPRCCCCLDGWCGRVFVSGESSGDSLSSSDDGDTDADAGAVSEPAGGMVYPSLAVRRRSFAVLNFGVEVVVSN